MKKYIFPITFFGTIVTLLAFPVWSHFNLVGKINSLGNNPDQIVGASTLFAQNASVQGNLAFFGEIKPDGLACSNGQILKRTGANDWDCAADTTGSVSSNSLDFDEFVNAMTLDANTSISFSTFGYEFNLNSTGDFVISDNDSNVFTIWDTGTASLSSNLELTGVASYLAIGDAGVRITNDNDGGLTFLGLGNGSDEDLTMNLDDVSNTVTFTTSTGVTVIDYSLASMTLHLGTAGVSLTEDGDGALTILSRGNGSGGLESFTINLDDTANVIGISSATGVTKFDFGTLGIDLDSGLLIIPTAAAGPTVVDATSNVGIHQASSSFLIFDGTAERRIPSKVCKTWAYEDPTAINEWGRVYFDDPFTITDVTTVTSGSNAVGWNMDHGLTGAITTDLFSANKSASSTFTYTTFADATLTNGEFIMLDITSASAKIENLDVTVCGRYDP